MSNDLFPVLPMNAYGPLPGVDSVEIRGKTHFKNDADALAFVNMLVAANALQTYGLPAASQAEMVAGTETALRAVSPLRVAQAIAATATAAAAAEADAQTAINSVATLTDTVGSWSGAFQTFSAALNGIGGLVKCDGAGNFAAAVADVDFASVGSVSALSPAVSQAEADAQTAITAAATAQTAANTAETDAQTAITNAAAAQSAADSANSSIAGIADGLSAVAGSVDSLTTAVAGKANRLLTINNQTAGYTFVASDANEVVVRMSTGDSLVVPTNDAVAFPIGTQLMARQIGDLQFAVTPSGGVTVNTPETLTTRKKGSMIMLYKVDTNEWDITGDLQPA